MVIISINSRNVSSGCFFFFLCSEILPPLGSSIEYWSTALGPRWLEFTSWVLCILTLTPITCLNLVFQVPHIEKEQSSQHTNGLIVVVNEAIYLFKVIGLVPGTQHNPQSLLRIMSTKVGSLREMQHLVTKSCSLFCPRFPSAEGSILHFFSPIINPHMNQWKWVAVIRWIILIWPFRVNIHFRKTAHILNG